MMGSDFERRDSRKRRRLSERRRVFSRIGLSGEKDGMLSGSGGAGSLSTEQSSWSSSSYYTHNNTLEDQQSRSNSRSDSPPGEKNKILMKIQFHIAVAPENEPLIVDTNCLSGSLSNAAASTRTSETSSNSRKKSISESIGDHIHERLSRQNTASTRRRQHLLAMHNQTALDTAKNTNSNRRASALSQSNHQADQEQVRVEVQVHSDDINNPLAHRRATAGEPLMPSTTRGGDDTTLVGEPGARSSTMSDEATVEFLVRHNASHQQQVKQASNHNREHIFFKRDGQRFGHEFTLKLAVDRTYRCLLKVRPLIPLQGISIQGQHVLYADCSQTGSVAAAAAVVSASASAPASSTALNKQSWQNIQHTPSSHQQPLSTANHYHQHQHERHLSCSGYQQQQFDTAFTSLKQQHSHRLYHAQTTTSVYRTNAPSATIDAKLLARSLLYQQQQSQMMRHFAACSASSSNSHFGSQLIYMFDWSASRFEVNKNKARTQVQTVLKFKNGQILSLPLQVKFYQSECKQHLNWGSQLHFIDYDCSVNSMGQINVDRVQYY